MIEANEKQNALQSRVNSLQDMLREQEEKEIKLQVSLKHNTDEQKRLVENQQRKDEITKSQIDALTQTIQQEKEVVAQKLK